MPGGSHDRRCLADCTRHVRGAVLVTSRRRAQIVSKLVEDVVPERTANRLCEVCVEVVGVSSAALILMSDDVGHSSMSTGDPVAVAITKIQQDHDEGPAVDAHRLGQAVYEPDLGSSLLPRWPIFQRAASDLGVSAVFGLPLRVGGIRLGALSLHSDKPGPLTADQETNALILSTIAAQAILVLQANPPPGMLVTELQANAEYAEAVNTASGMVAIQLGVSVAQALIQMRRYAFSTESPLIDLSRRVIARTLRFDDLNAPVS